MPTILGFDSLAGGTDQQVFFAGSDEVTLFTVGEAASAALANGTPNKAYINVSAMPFDLRVVVYDNPTDDVKGDLLAYSDVFTVAGTALDTWVSQDMAVTTALSTSGSYWLGIHVGSGSGDWPIFNNGATGGTYKQIQYDSLSFASGPPASLSAETADFTGDLNDGFPALYLAEEASGSVGQSRLIGGKLVGGLLVR